VTAAIQVRGLIKHFGDTRAVDGISLDVEQGSVHGILGPNGAGKTTTVRILSTLALPDGGQAFVGGYDVVRQAQQVRRVIGLTGQYAAVDEQISGWDNLYLIGRLLNLTRSQARRRCGDLLEQFDLVESGRKLVRQYSGGMRRRLDLAASLVGRPGLLFLDEPTTGLDPRSRNALWDTVRELVAAGTTVLLTTQYMEEAEALATSIDVIDKGKVVASGTPDQLRAQIGGQVLHVRPAVSAELNAVPAILELVGLGGGTIDSAAGSYGVAISSEAQLTAAVRQLGSSGLHIGAIETRLPSLDDVFLTLTGAPASRQESPAAEHPPTAVGG
jgi:oleandomycin transport system ATP-binding protein